MNIADSFVRLEKLVLDSVTNTKQIALIRNMLASIGEQLEAYDTKVLELKTLHQKEIANIRAEHSKTIADVQKRDIQAVKPRTVKQILNDIHKNQKAKEREIARILSKARKIDP